MRKEFWFGTPNNMQWIPAPLAGADMSPEGWNNSGTYLGGGGFSRQSRATHKNYIFEWPGSSSREMAQLMKDYRDGVWSTPDNPLIYFIDPLIYDQNILPAGWAAPGSFVTKPNEFTPLGRVTPDTSAHGQNLPVTGAAIVEGKGSILVTSQPNTAVYFNVWASGTYNSSNSAKVAGSPVTGSPSSLGDGISRYSASVAIGPTGLLELELQGGDYTLWGMRASLEAGTDWSGGMGHSGVQFVGEPTYIANTGVHGGQIGYAASFTETGSWLQ